MNNLHQDVEKIGRGFRVIGVGTPSGFEHKAKLILTPNFKGESIAVALIDTIRCTSTILAAFAAGLQAMTIREKNTTGTTIKESQMVAKSLGLTLELAGELHGHPKLPPRYSDSKLVII